ncbi:MAG: HAMP domain-containing histidine kinase [Chthoniobacterales bacterium]|nr:HAMP domain-containing histidine kinase [Chthoniobacterales bacterium]
MRSEAIESKLAELRADPESIPWPERVRVAGELLGGVVRTRPLPAVSAELLRLLAADPKWEVRKQVADHLHKLSDSDFGVFAGLLSGDVNAYVKSAVEQSLVRRRKGRAMDTKRVRGLSRIEADIRQIEIRHGAKASRTIREMAHRLYEGLVGASVHEMRSIVTAMKATVESLEASPGEAADPNVKKAARRLSRQVSFLDRLLNDMRYYTQVPSRERATERVGPMLNDALSMVRDEFKATARNAEAVSVFFSVSEDLCVSASRMHLVLALRNLLKNAHEAFSINETEFQPGRVQVTADGQADAVRIVIEDNGMGMAPAELEEVRRFIPGRTSKSYLGTGFGLPIAHRTLEAHGGTLTITSQVDQGTTVTVLLPVAGKAEE